MVKEISDDMIVAAAHGDEERIAPGPIARRAVVHDRAADRPVAGRSAP